MSISEQVYYCDKYILLKVSRRPPAWDQQVMQTLVGWVCYGIWVHAAMGCWMMGNRETFPSETLVDVPGADVLTDSASESPMGAISSMWSKWIGRALSGGGLPFFALLAVVTAYFIVQIVRTFFGATLGLVAEIIFKACCAGACGSGAEVERGHAEDNGIT